MSVFLLKNFSVLCFIVFNAVTNEDKYLTVCTASFVIRGIAFWDGKSRGTKSTIDFFEKKGKRIKVIKIEKK